MSSSGILAVDRCHARHVRHGAAMLRPIGHQPSAFIEQGAARIGCFGLVFQLVRQRVLDYSRGYASTQSMS